MLFCSTTGTCTYCGKKGPGREIADGYLCQECAEYCSRMLVKIGKADAESFKVLPFKNAQLMLNIYARSRIFRPTVSSSSIAAKVEFDEDLRLWRYPPVLGKYWTFEYTDILSFKTILETSKKRVPGAGGSFGGGTIGGEKSAIASGNFNFRSTSDAVVVNYGIEVKVANNHMVPVVRIMVIENGEVGYGSITHMAAISTVQEIAQLFQEVTQEPVSVKQKYKTPWKSRIADVNCHLIARRQKYINDNVDNFKERSANWPLKGKLLL